MLDFIFNILNDLYKEQPACLIKQVNIVISGMIKTLICHVDVLYGTRKVRQSSVHLLPLLEYYWVLIVVIKMSYLYVIAQAFSCFQHIKHCEFLH